MLYYVYQIKGGKSAKQAIRTCSTGGRMTQKKKIVGSLILAGMLIGSNVLWYNHTKELEVKLESRSQAIQILDTSVKKQAEYVNELKVDLQSKNEEISELKGQVQKASQLSYNVREYEITFYAPTGSLTASGTVPQVGRTVACNSLPLGCHVIINGHEYVVEDTGGMSGNVIDIFVGSEEEAIQLGRQRATVQILN